MCVVRQKKTKKKNTVLFITEIFQMEISTVFYLSLAYAFAINDLHDNLTI